MNTQIEALEKIKIISAEIVEKKDAYKVANIRMNEILSLSMKAISSYKAGEDLEQEGQQGKRALRWYFPKNNEWPNDKELVHFDDNSLTMHLGRFYEKDQWGREKMFVTTEGSFFDSTMVDSWIPIFWTDKKETWDKSLLYSKK